MQAMRERASSRLFGFGVAALLVVAGLAALPLLVPRVETRAMDAKARAGTSGEYIELSDGIVHYELAGPEAAPTVVFVCGLSTPYFIWDFTVPALTAAGYRTLRYDLYGRGFSDRPTAVRYDADLFDRQLLELIERLKLRTPLTLAGVSMGGAISVIFAERHPERVNGLILVDPAGFPLPLPLDGEAREAAGSRRVPDAAARRPHDPGRDGLELPRSIRCSRTLRASSKCSSRTWASSRRSFRPSGTCRSSRWSRAIERSAPAGIPVLLSGAAPTRVIPFETSAEGEGRDSAGGAARRRARRAYARTMNGRRS